MNINIRTLLYMHVGIVYVDNNVCLYLKLPI